MRKILLTLIQYLVFFGLGGLLIWWQFGKLTATDKQEIFVAFEQVEHRLWLLIPVFFVGFLSHFFRALRWKLMLVPLKLYPTTTNITFAVLIGYLVNLLVPRMGEVARCSVLAKYEREPVDKIVGTIVAERSFDMVCLVLVSLITFFLQVEVAGAYIEEQLGQLALKRGILAVVFGAMVFFIALLIFLYKKKRETRLGKFLRGIGYGILSIRFMHQKGLFLLYTALIWFCYLASIYIAFRAMDATIHLGWLPALSVLIFGSLGMIVTPGGIGAYPPAVQLVLVQLYQVKSSFALAFGWVSWLGQTAIILILGILTLILLPLYNVGRDGKKSMD